MKVISGNVFLQGNFRSRMEDRAVFALESEGFLPGLALFFMQALISWLVSWMGTSLWETQRC